MTAQIVNYSKLLVPTETKDTSYADYSIIENSRGVWEFLHKDSFDSVQEELELRLKAKREYACKSPIFVNDNKWECFIHSE